MRWKKKNDFVFTDFNCIAKYIYIRDTAVKKVKSFFYLRNQTTNKYTIEIKIRMALVKQAFAEKQNLLTNGHLSIKTRKFFVKTFVRSVVLNGSESGTLSILDTRRTEALGMRTRRKVTKIHWTERKSNEEVLNLVQESRQIIKMIEVRRFKIFGHVLRHDTFITNIMDGKIGRGRSKNTNLGNIKKLLFLTSFEKMKGLAEKREERSQRRGEVFR